MEFRTIGDLSASVVGLGCNQFGTAACDEETSVEVIDEALDAGISYFDVADEYGIDYADRSSPAGWGRSEEILGRALQGRRDGVVIATKFGAHVPGQGGAVGGNGRRWIRHAAEASLRRLRTDRIDLYQVHFPDPTVPIEETLFALDELVGEGKVREIGCCNFTGEAIRDARSAAERLDTRPFVSAQNALNLFRRAALDDQVPACAALDMAFIPYYPLASGVLTGKYRRGEAPPTGARLADQVDAATRDRLLSEKTFARLDALEALAHDHGRDLLQLAFAWLLAQPAVATVIAGAARPGQATANAAAATWRLTAEEVEAATRAVA